MVDEDCFQMRIAVVLSSLVMQVGLFKRRELFQPCVNILNETVFIVIHIDPGCYVHG